MAKKPIPRAALKQVQPLRYAFNGIPVLVNGVKKTAAAFNYVQAYRTKRICSFSQDIVAQSLGATGSGTTELCHFRFRSSPRAAKVRFRFGVLPISGVDSLDSLTTPRIRARVLEKDAAKSSDQLTGAVGVPSHGIPGQAADTIAIATVDHDISAETEYVGWVLAEDGQRLAFVEVCEASDPPLDDSTAGVSDLTVFGDENPIEDADWSDMRTANNELPDKLGNSLIDWTRHNENKALTIQNVGTTWTNAFDGSSTSVTSTTPGFRVDLTNRGDADGNVKVRLLWRAQSGGAGTSNGIRFSDETDGELGKVEDIPSGTPDKNSEWNWFFVDTTLTAKSYKIDVQAYESDDEELRIDAFAMQHDPHA